MADKPHVVPRRPAGSPKKPEEPAAAAPPKRVVESRPTSNLDKNELLRLVGDMRRSTTPDPDAESEGEATIEVTNESSSTIPTSKPTASALPVEKRIVRTVARRRTPIVGMSPLTAEPAASPVVVPKAAAAGDEQYVDLFAEGSEPSIATIAKPEPVAPVESAIVATPMSSSASEPVAAVVDSVIDLPHANELATPAPAPAHDTELDDVPTVARPSGQFAIPGSFVDPGQGGYDAAPVVEPPVAPPVVVAPPVIATTAAPDVTTAPAAAKPSRAVWIVLAIVVIAMLAILIDVLR